MPLSSSSNVTRRSWNRRKLCHRLMAVKTVFQAAIVGFSRRIAATTKATFCTRSPTRNSRPVGISVAASSRV